MMNKNITRTTLFATACVALLFALTTTANAQGFAAYRPPMAQPAPGYRPIQPIVMPQRPPMIQHPPHHVQKPALVYHPPMVLPKPAPVPVVCNALHHTPPPVVIVAQAPRPTLLQRIADVFR